MNYKPPYWYHDNIKFNLEEIVKLKNDIETYKVNNKNFEQIINKQKEKILE